MIEDLIPAEVAERMRGEKPPLLLDVRETWERRVAQLPEDLHIPLHELPHRAAELDPDRDIVVYCHHGTRSLHAIRWLTTEGFDRLANLRGGIQAWSREVDASVPQYQ